VAIARYGGKLVACRKRERWYAERVDHDVRIEPEYEGNYTIPAGSYVIYSPNGVQVDYVSPEEYERMFEVEEDSV
jgi:hypothetical protein